MASQYIQVLSATSSVSSDVRQLVDGLRRAQELAVKVNDLFQQIASGSDWTSLGGLLGVSAANAEIIYNLVVALQDDLVVADINALVDRVG